MTMTDEEAAELKRLRTENTYLRGLVQHNPDWKCLHGYDVPAMSFCPLGFPGCGCADDLLIGEMEAAEHKFGEI